LIGLYKAECVRHDGPWRGPEDLELATLSRVYWFNTARLHRSLGHVPPVEFEENYYRQNDSPATKAGGSPSSFSPSRSLR